MRRALSILSACIVVAFMFTGPSTHERSTEAVAGSATIDSPRIFQIRASRLSFVPLSLSTTTTTVAEVPAPEPAPVTTPVSSQPPTTEARPARVAPVAPATTIKRPPAPAGNAGGVWACIREHESGGNYQRNSGNGYYGAYQFSISTWQSMGTGYSRADLAPPGVQDDAARRLQARSGWGQWPQTSRMCGVR